MGLAVESYIFKGHMFCLEFLSQLTGCSLYTLKIVLQDFKNGINLYSHGNKGAIRQESTATIKAICWLKCFRDA